MTKAPAKKKAAPAVTVTLRHALDVGHCRSGVRAWLEANDLTMADLKAGIPADVIRAIGDRHAMEVLAHAEEEAKRG